MKMYLVASIFSKSNENHNKKTAFSIFSKPISWKEETLITILDICIILCWSFVCLNSSDFPNLFYFEVILSITWILVISLQNYLQAECGSIYQSIVSSSKQGQTVDDVLESLWNQLEKNYKNE